MNKGLITLTITLVSGISVLFGQTSSPYSQFGLGDWSNKGFGYSESMGGIGIGLQSEQHIVNNNPASYSGIDTLFFIYEVGISGQLNKIKSNNASLLKTNTSIDYFAVAFKVNKHWFTSMGVVPVTKMDYTFKTVTDDKIIGKYNTYYYGDGGINQIYWGNSVKFGNLSYGLSTGLAFGSVNQVTSILFGYSADALHTKYDNRIVITDMLINNGVQYSIKLPGNSKLIVGATYETSLSRIANNKFNNTTFDNIAGTISSANVDEEFYKDIHYKELTDTILMLDMVKGVTQLPTNYGLGISFTKPNKLTLGADINFYNYSQLKSDYLETNFKNSMSVKAGFEFIPDKNNINNYFKRWHYRAGGYYTQSHININGQLINDYGVTFGVGLPFFGSKTTINLSGKIGQRGTFDQNLLKETYGILSLNLSLSDIWFIKRKFY